MASQHCLAAVDQLQQHLARIDIIEVSQALSEAVEEIFRPQGSVLECGKKLLPESVATRKIGQRNGGDGCHKLLSPGSTTQPKRFGRIVAFLYSVDARYIYLSSTRSTHWHESLLS
jgi:hypothetical protein